MRKTFQSKYPRVKNILKRWDLVDFKISAQNMILCKKENPSFPQHQTSKNGYHDRRTWLCCSKLGNHNKNDSILKRRVKSVSIPFYWCNNDEKRRKKTLRLTQSINWCDVRFTPFTDLWRNLTFIKIEEIQEKNWNFTNRRIILLFTRYKLYS